MDALLFDCDGVLAETERDGHRVAFNQAFEAFGLDAHWSAERYGELLSTGGGKERLRRYFDEAGWPPGVDDPDRLIAELHARKTANFRELARGGGMPLRPGVARLVDAALAAALPIGVCSTANIEAVQAIVQIGLGARRAQAIAVFAGDAVATKKPDPAIYTLALDRLNAAPARTLAVEDSRNGLRAAKAAGLRCLVTPSAYTATEDFREADRVLPDLGDAAATGVTLADCRALCEER